MLKFKNSIALALGAFSLLHLASVSAASVSFSTAKYDFTITSTGSVSWFTGINDYGTAVGSGTVNAFDTVWASYPSATSSSSWSGGTAPPVHISSKSTLDANNDAEGIAYEHPEFAFGGPHTLESTSKTQVDAAGSQSSSGYAERWAYVQTITATTITIDAVANGGLSYSTDDTYASAEAWSSIQSYDANSQFTGDDYRSLFRELTSGSGSTSVLDNFTTQQTIAAGGFAFIEFGVNTTAVSSVPLPAAIWLLAPALMGLIRFRKRSV